MSLKELTEMTTKSGFKWIIIFVPGLLFSIFTLIMGLILLDGQGGFSGAGHAGIIGAVLGVMVLFIQDFFATSLILLSMILFPPLYFMIANKITIKYIISYIFKHNFKDDFIEKLLSFVNKSISKRTDKLDKVNDFANVKLDLLKSIKTDTSTSKLEKRVLLFLLKKSKLEDTTMTKDTKISDMIVEKANQTIKEITKSNNNAFYITFSIHLTLLILAIIF
ncbi:hypothetical protein A9Q91_05060 [Candidatus Gracilibacteria bacterium 28_42_T64]|nr:hypothetical protein A9Q91_05060 [Candidatus Gracilibacteria bacterium 28_42_T64]